MSLPEFDDDGNLPAGVHIATTVEMLDRFASGSPRRVWLAERLEELLALAKSTGRLERVIVWGSSVTAKEVPNDLDLLLVMSRDFELDAVAESARVVFDHVQARIAYSADVFWTKASIGEEALALWLDTYQTSRDLRHRGIVEVSDR